MATIVIVSIVFAPVLAIWLGFSAFLFDQARHVLDDYTDKKKIREVRRN